MGYRFLTLSILACLAISCGTYSRQTGRSTMEKSDKMVIYQMMVRLFGNKHTNNSFNGSVSENGTGKFIDINERALKELKELGISHIWFTGVIEHAGMTDYSSFGIKQDDPDIVKGRAGSPYAIKDYYDVDPDLAVNVRNRMQEFEELIDRTHRQGLKVLIDFVPNHVARTYNSDAKPAGVEDFGARDDRSRSFHPANDFYYIPGKGFVVPEGTNAGGDAFTHPMKDMLFDEPVAKATGNNVFSEKPSINDWSETVKLNYGIDYSDNEKTWFEPVPPVWIKMKDILLFWADKNVDGFRCDVAEMVPVEFWAWVIPEIKKAKPGILFIAESYNPASYQKYLSTGQFDYLYDKVGTYDALKRLIKNEPAATVADLSRINAEQQAFSDKLLYFLENHDEERLASDAFVKDPWLALPAMVVSATQSSGPVMIYFGQEVGEPGKGKEGYGGEDNRTTIFDYWGVPEHQKWMNKGLFDGAGLSADQKKLRGFYKTLLNFSKNSKAISNGAFTELRDQPGFSKRNYAYLRHTKDEVVLVVNNFDRDFALNTTISIPAEFVPKGKVDLTNILSGKKLAVSDMASGIPVSVPAMSSWIIEFNSKNDEKSTGEAKIK